MDPVSDDQEVSWFADNWLLILFNIIFGAVTCILIWICTRSDKGEPQEECSSKDKKPCEEQPSVEKSCKEEPSKEVPCQDVKEDVEEVVEECTVEEIVSVESTDEIIFDHHDEPSVKGSTQEVVEEIEVEELSSELHTENEDILDHHEGEVESQVKVETSDSNSEGEGYVVIKQVESEKVTVETVGDISELTTYEIDVRTGDVSGAGTDAHVFVIIYGTNGDTGKIHLEKSSTHKSKFEKNHIDSFTEEAPNVGKLDKIRIGHDNKGGFAGWYLADVVINVPSLNCKWTFTADRWLDKKEADKQIEIDIYPSLVVETFEETIYEEATQEDIVVKDCDTVVSHAELVDTETDDGTKTTVSFTKDTKIVSQNEMIVEEVTITTSEEIRTATFNVGGEDTHTSSHVAVEAVVDHDSQETCSEIVEDVKEEKEFDLHAYSDDALQNLVTCVEKTDEISGVKRFDIVLPDTAVPDGDKDKIVTYNVDVKTGDVSGAGTNANVFIIIYGTKKNTGILELKKSHLHRNKFEKDQLDTFSIEGVDVGKIQKIRIGHDNKGGFAGWYLDYVIVITPGTNAKETFVATRWLDKKEADGKLEIDLYTLSSPELHDEDQNMEKRDEKVSVDLDLDLDELEKLTDDYIGMLHTTDENETVSIECKESDKAKAPTEDTSVSYNLELTEDEIISFEETVEVESAPMTFDMFDEEVVEAEGPIEDTRVIDIVELIEDEIVSVEETVEVENEPESVFGSSCSTNEVEFQVVDYHFVIEDENWEMASINDVESHMENVRNILYDKDWHICALVDGSISGPGYNYEISDETKELGHKLIVKRQTPVSVCSSRQVEFNVVEYDFEVHDDWRLASIIDVAANMEKVQEAFSDKEWHICSLSDGNVGGPGYNYNIDYEVKELGHKLIVKGLPELRIDPPLVDPPEPEIIVCSISVVEFNVVEYDFEVHDDWRLASISDVETNMDKVQEALSDKEWHICSLSDGNVGGPGYNYNIDYEVKELGHKLIVKGLPDAQVLVSLPSPEVEVQVVVYDSKLVDGWRLASIKDVEDNMGKVQEALTDKDWYICALIDGSVGGGVGYNYNIEYEVEELGHKLIIKGGSSHDIDAVIKANADNLVKTVLETVCHSSLKVEFKVVSCSEEVGDEWKLACINDVNNNEDVAKYALQGKTWHVCALLDGTIGGEGYNHEIKNEINNECEHKLLVKGIKVDTSVDQDIATVHEGRLDDTADLLDGSVSVSTEISLDDTGDLIVAPSTPVTVDVEISDVTKNERKKSGSTSSSDEDVADEDVMKLFKKFDKDGDGRISIEEFMLQLKKDKKKKKKEKKKAKKEKRRSREHSHSHAEAPCKEVEFQVVDFHSIVDSNWRVASIYDVEVNMEKVQTILSDKPWHICGLADGNIGGPAYNYGIRHEVKEVGYKLLTTVLTMTYDIDVKTGDHTGAGTDANVFIIVFGHQISTGKIELKESKTHKSMFERNHVDSFTIDAIDVGQIVKIIIGHDNKGGFAGWYLDNVEISCPSKDVKLTFIADRWVDLKEDDGKLEVELYPLKRIGSELNEEIIVQSPLQHKHVCLDALDMLASEEHIEVECEVHVECEVPLEIHEDSKTVEISKEEEDALKASSVPTPPECKEEIIAEDVLAHTDVKINLDLLHHEDTTSCEISKEEEDAAIKIQSLIRGAKARKEVEALKDTSSSPLLSVQTVEVRIDEPSTQHHTEEHITVEEVGELESAGHVRFVEELVEMITYEIDIKTGDVIAAGTDANVFITIFGEKGDTGKIELETPKNLKEKTFERNCEDSFIVEADDVGTITSIRIGHDNKGGFAGWYLEKVVIHIPVRNSKLTFEANRWLDKKEGDGKLEVDIAPSKEDQCDLMCEPFENVVKEIPEETKVEFIVQNDSPLAAENILHKSEENVTTDVKDDKCYEVEVKEIVAEIMKYNIDVKTGDIKFAGTDANVFIILYGDLGYTTKIELKKSKTHKSPFERKQVDTFEVETINVGNIEKVRIGHDNHGGFAGWYIDDVVIHAPSVDRKWTFPANRWLDKHKDDGKLEIDLYLSTK